VVGSCEYSDETLCPGATELVVSLHKLHGHCFSCGLRIIQ
jgi:hypothetical protein